MPTLVEGANVSDTALSVLVRKGYQVWYDKRIRRFFAEKDGWDFSGLTPSSLLGMIAIFEHVRPAEYTEYWWRLSRTDFKDIASEPKPFVSAMPAVEPWKPT